jgi:hypothetical protein
MVIIDVFSRRFVGFAVQRGEADGPAVPDVQLCER